MSMGLSLATVKGRVKRIPAVRAWLHARFHERFLSARGFATYYGVYGSFGEARAQLPTSKEFDSHEVITGLMNERMHRVYPCDYPVLFWLREAFLGGATGVFDIGGSVGVHYYAYRRVLPYPEGLQWIVCEVPSAAAVGRAMAERLDVRELRFVDTLNTADIRLPVWISAGALQYIEDGDIERLLAECRQPPHWLLLNKLPVYDGDDFVVTQNIGPGIYAPAHVYNRARLVERIRTQGYELADSWEVPERAFYLPGHPDKCFPSFSGFCFRADATPPHAA
jgi:putative methyltransferase (TIGR04325 family)